MVWYEFERLINQPKDSYSNIHAHTSTLGVSKVWTNMFLLRKDRVGVQVWVVARRRGLRLDRIEVILRV